MSRLRMRLLLCAMALSLLIGCAPKASYNQVVPDFELSFPRDHWAHPGHSVEWWYFTGQLQAADGSSYGFELVFFEKRTEGDFRMGIPVWWVANPAHIAHFAITDPQGRKFTYAERIGLHAPLHGGASADKFVLWNEDWRALALGSRTYLHGQMPGFELDLLVEPTKPPVLHGENGFSRKGEGGGASYYVSLTRLEAQGLLSINGKPLTVSGQAWMDHEILSPQLDPNVRGWDWFSIQLDNGYELMLFTLNTKDGGVDPWSSGTIVFPDGSYEHFYSAEFEKRSLSYWTSRESRAGYPSSWNIKVPRYGIDLVVLPVLPDQELRPQFTQITYWEGAVEVQGMLDDEPVTGKGYVELSGYDRPVDF